MKQIMIDSSTMSTLILILKKKVHRFLFRFLSMHERKLWKKKMINVHTVNNQKNKEIEIFVEFLCSEYSSFKNKVRFATFLLDYDLPQLSWLVYLSKQY